ncbi:MAG: hypothetical protein UT82_C0018G0016 [Parcubacteria group bacterium GW2011_GWB1_40_14]|nr:MAG: hypothetical protein UT82_C0018G0016 [Parcubacteria group bacterium GW2011_GWB1_40_14]
MPTALEQLRQGIGGVQPTSALDLLRQGVGKEEVSTLAIFPPEEKPGFLSRIAAGFKGVLKGEAPIQKKVREFLKPEIAEEITPSLVVSKEGFPFLKGPGDTFIDPIFTAGLEKVGTKIASSFISRMAKETDTKVIKQLASLAGEAIDDITAKLVGEAKTPTAVKQILDINAQKIASKAAPRITAKEEFKIGDILDPQGKTNMVGNVKIREITGNTLKFVDSEGTEFAGMQRSTVRNLIKEGSWKKVDQPAPRIAPELEPLAQEARRFGYEVNFIDKKPKDYYGKHFSDSKRIEIYIKGRTPQQIQDTLDHELGHIFDYQRRGIIADPMGDSIKGLDGKLRAAQDSDIYFRDSRLKEAEAIRKEVPKIHTAATTQKEIYADAFKLFRRNPEKLKEIAPRIYNEVSNFYNQATKQVDTGLDALAVEARKYKSAEEFVREVRSDKVFYRGGVGEPDLTKPIFISRNADLALSYSPAYPDIARAEKDLRAFIRKPGKTLDIYNVEDARKFLNEKILEKPIGKDEFVGVREVVFNNWSKIINRAKNEGYDYIRHLGEGKFKGGMDEELVVLNPQKSLTKLTNFYNQAVRGVKEITPAGVEARAIIAEAPKAEDTISKLIKAIDDSVPLRGEQKKLYHEELAKRTARVAAMGEKVAGEKGFFAQLGQLKGPLPKAQFEAIKKQFSQGEIDSLFDSIEKTKTLLPLEKVATKGGLRNLLEGIVPTKSEIEHLREVFPKELIDSVLARRPLLERVKDLAGEIWNIPRTMMATLDLSAPFRQGVFMLGRPIRFAQAFKDMFKFAVSEKAYQGLIEGIKARPTYLKMKEGGLALTEIGGPLLKREERFMGQLAERIPGYGALVRASNRAYTGFLNKMRADIFDDILTKAEILGRDIEEPLLRSIADFVNSGTGRGKFGLFETGVIPKSMEKAAVVLNGVFFSPRLMASRLNLLNPYFYVQLDPLVRKEAIRTLFATSGILGSIYGLWKLNGGDVGIDPRSADFGKLKIRNTRYDILGGFQQYIKLAAQLITGEIVSSTTGRTITLGEGFKPLTRREIILRFFESKESPLASFFTGWLQGTTLIGGKFDLPTEIINRFLPMAVQDMYDIAQERGAEGILYGLPAIFGTGVQTYGKQELVFGESKIGEQTAEIRPVPELAEKIRELVLGQLPLGASASFSVEAYFDQLSNLPREEANEIFEKIKESNPDLAKKLFDVIKERQIGITVKDKDLKSKGVASGDRALAVKKELDRLETKEKKIALWEDYAKKGIITKEVGRQLNVLYGK